MIKIISMIFLFMLFSVSSYATLPLPPAGTTPQTMKLGYFSEDSAYIRIWHDTNNTFYISVNPISSKPCSLYNGFFSFWNSENSEWEDLYFFDEHNSKIPVVNERTTFYLGTSSLNYKVFDVTQQTLIRNINDQPGYTYYYYPRDFFNGTPYYPPCTCDDTDNDGVPDAWDKCPQTPENSAVDKTGCPKKTGVVVVPMFP